MLSSDGNHDITDALVTARTRGGSLKRSNLDGVNINVEKRLKENFCIQCKQEVGSDTLMWQCNRCMLLYDIGGRADCCEAVVLDHLLKCTARDAHDQQRFFVDDKAN